MTFQMKPRVAETTTTTGTTDFSLSGSLTAHDTFASKMSNADTTEYLAVAVDGSGNPTGEWEEGKGTFATGPTLQRTTVTNSSTGSKVSFAAGTKVVFMFPLASRMGGDLTGCTADGTSLVGFRGVPQNTQTANYTTVLSDAGKHIYHPASDGSARIYTIDSNANVAYPIGTAITFVNRHATLNVSIAITSDTLRLAVTGATGTRTLAPYGTATALKIEATEWLINGSGLS